jgi:hypothetical protein
MVARGVEDRSYLTIPPNPKRASYSVLQGTANNEGAGMPHRIVLGGCYTTVRHVPWGVARDSLHQVV